ncbi:uncharacterized protein LOC122250443 isoform X2 [Penaeus japonicus]|nr:uncharacterized protein LOC122246233 isoform X2 [Penaeus japonicus]XP_042867784.1 uncharacterized protein LOC122250443 isoform X2 [Penaeus japonicus]
MAENDHLRWMRINRELLINLPAGRYAVAWRNFVITLYEQIEHWMEQRRRDVRHTMWDFCVIHSCNKRDRVAAAEFKRLLETTLGIVGRTFGDIELGENTLEAASTMVTGSTKVFIIVSRYLDLQDYPKFVFQSALMEQLRRPDWRRKLVPLYLPGTRDNPPFLLANIQGLTLGNDPRTVELVSHDIPVDDQIRVRQQRQRAEANLREELRRGRAQRLSEIRDVVAELREQFGDNHDPTGALDQ